MNASVIPWRGAAGRDTRDLRADRRFRWLVTGAGMLVLAILLSAALSIAWGGREAFQRFGFAFLWSSVWDPVGQQFGAWVPIYGTLVTAFLALLIAVPVSFSLMACAPV